MTRRGHTGAVARAVLRQALLVGTASVFLLPLLWVIAASLRTPGLPPTRTIEWLPEPLSLGNYLRVFELVPLAAQVGNSLVVAAVAVPTTLVVASWAGYAMAQLPDRWRGRLVIASLALLMIPASALFLTRYVLFTWMGLVDSLAALAIPAVMGSSPLFVLLFYWTFRRMPGEILDAAQLDGLGPFQTWARIAMPLAAPTTLTVAVLAFLFYWSDFVNPLLYLKSDELYTLPVGVRQLQQLDRSNWPLLMAGAVVMTAPAIAVFLGVQRVFLGTRSAFIRPRR